MSEELSLFDRWFPWFVGLHWALAVLAVLSGVWGAMLFCMWVPTQGVTDALGVVWLILTLAPFLGLLALGFHALRKAYAGLVIVSPIFLGLMFSLNQVGVTYCDGP